MWFERGQKGHHTRQFEGGALKDKSLPRGGTCPWCPPGSATYDLMALKTTSYVSYDAPEVDLDSVPNSEAEDSDSNGVGDSDADVNIG